MIKKTITFEDYNGETHKEDFYFNLTKAEVLEMETIVKGGLSTILKHIVETDDTTEMVNMFKEIIHKAYGVKSADGKRFVKSNDVLEDFIYSAAYSELYMELATNENSAVEFINGIMPKGMGPKTKVKAPIEAIPRNE